MRFLGICCIGLLLIFSGCTTTNVNTRPTFNTYNTSSNVKQKSTTTYPGSAQQPIVSKSIPKTQMPKTEPEQIPVINESTIITSMAIPSPSTSVEVAEEVISRPIASQPSRSIQRSGPMIKIAVLVPQKTIKKYAITTVNSSISYLLYKNYNFDLNVFNSGDEKESSIRATLENIKAGGYNFIIAPVTPEGAQIIANAISSDTLVFIPTLHVSSIHNAGENIVFGGIDYDQQITLLSEHANHKVGTFEDGSGLSYQLNALVKKKSERVFYEKRVENAKANFKQFFKDNHSLNEASFYLNTPLVTTSLIASQLRANDIYPHVLLSTQISYNPLLLTLTQYEDRDKMYIANSIQKTPAQLEEINALFGHDIIYDWVNYSTSIGTDFLCDQFFRNDTGKTFNESIKNNQVVYNTTLYKPGRSEFIKISN